MISYIDIVNRVLKRLRERPVETVEQNVYSTLIGMLVNDAKDEVEASWNWSALRGTLSASTTAGLFSYELNGTGNNPRIIDVINDDSNWFMEYRDVHWFNNAYLNQDQVFGAPKYYTFNGVSSDGDTQVDIYPVPDAIYNLRFNVVYDSQPLVDDGDFLVIPQRPVELLAYAKAIEERGEDAGINSGSAYATAYKALGDEISYDAHVKHPEELIAYVV